MGELVSYDSRFIVKKSDKQPVSYGNVGYSAEYNTLREARQGAYDYPYYQIWESILVEKVDPESKELEPQGVRKTLVEESVHE